MAKGSYKAIQQKGVVGLAWASFGIAIAGGALVSGTFIGTMIRNILGIFEFWPWFVPVLLLGAVISICLDTFLDGEPNQLAIYGALCAPTIASSTNGKLGDVVTDWSTTLLHWMATPMQEWAGTGSSTGLAIACVAASLLMAQRVVKKGRRQAVAS